MAKPKNDMNMLPERALFSHFCIEYFGYSVFAYGYFPYVMYTYTLWGKEVTLHYSTIVSFALCLKTPTNHCHNVFSPKEF